MSPSPLHNAGVADARSAWLLACVDTGHRPLTAEAVPLAAARGRIVAEPVRALRSSPGFDAAAMDGIAVRADSTAGAAPSSPVALARGEFQPVDTGDPLPPGTDAVVMREHVGDTAAGAELRAPALPYANVRQVGEDVASGELVLAPGRTLRPTDLAVAAAAGLTELPVTRRAVVAILPTGSELVPLGAGVGPGQMLDTNSLMLAGLVEECGGVADCAPIQPDDPGLLQEALLRLAAAADLVLLVAGSSAGTDDYAASVIADSGRVIVHGVAVKPGHPVVLGMVAGTPVMGVPGYPVSAALAFDLFAAPLLARLQGIEPARRPRLRAELTRAVRSAAASDEWVRVRLGQIRGRQVATPLRRGAGVLTSLARADGLLLVPAGSAGVPAGAEVEIELLGPVAPGAALLAAGTTDPVVDLIAERAAVVVDADGSRNGLDSLRRGDCDVAVFAGAGVESGAAVRIAQRLQGLIVAPANPLGLQGIADLAQPGLRFVNRQEGSATRDLLDRLLGELEIAPPAVPGYTREARSHLAAAAAIAAGAADCALGVRSAAEAHGLDFVPVAEEELWLAWATGLEADPRLAGVLELLAGQSFREELEALGYDTAGLAPPMDGTSSAARAGERRAIRP